MGDPAPGVSPFKNEYDELDPQLGWSGTEEIVYSKYSFDKVGKKLVLTANPSSLVVSGIDVKAFAQGLLSAPPTGGVPRLRDPNANPRRPSALDILVEKRCYVVIELDEGMDWQFRMSGPGLTTKARYGAANGGIRYVEADGEITGNKAPKRPGCRILYFSVMARGSKYESQYFNLHVDMAQPSGAPIEVSIDPDIPNNGGGIP